MDAGETGAAMISGGKGNTSSDGRRRSKEICEDGLRQQLKETIRARQRKESHGVTIGKEIINTAPADSYGRFFGPSETIIADRVNENMKSWAEISNSASVVMKKLDGKLIKKDGDMNKSATVKTIRNAMEKRKKVAWLRETRDYSFLSSDHCENIPVPGNKVNISRPSEIQVSKIQGIKEKVKRDFETGTEISRSSEMMKGKGSKIQGVKETIKRYSETGTKISRPSDMMKGKGSKIQGVKETIKRDFETRTKISRPFEMAKEKSSKIQGFRVIKRDSETGVKISRDLKKPLEMRKKYMGSDKVKATGQKNPCLDGRKRKVEQSGDEEKEGINAISIIREMFGYDPTKFCDDDEKDVRMEASFDDIQKEERRSLRMAKKEDAEELRKLMRNSKKLKQMT
ncbi:hypothetical protein DH2020_022268 [Rehmannia glutinosa]|uniref:Protein SPT2 homolog n=1 Tax=Rehmannia glutinosa TaxID=99300 RepID=A0ABR0WCU8_REHGL